MRFRTAMTLLVLVVLGAVANAQDRVSLRPDFKAGDENRYTVNALVETIVTPKGPAGIGGNSRGQLTATVSVRVISIKEGVIEQEALVEAISFNANKAGSPAVSESKEVAGKKIEFAITSAGQLLKCVIPDSTGYLALADLLFSVFRWYPAADVNVGGTWEALGRGNLFTERLSEASMSASTIYTLAALSKGVASIDGAVTLNQSGSSVFNPGGGKVNVSVTASGKGSAHIDMDISAGRLIAGTTESRVEGTLVNIQPTAAGEKMNPREGSLVEMAKFSIKLIQ
ncbi:MAG TPA: DUF6263 family protein [Blastocatellia bacterium]|nr:DUF6263 family protein [Blastocatellia bacterium]